MTYPPGTLPVNRQNATPTKNTHPNDHNSQAAAINAIVQLIGGSGVRGPFEAGGQVFTTLEDLFQHLWDANKAVASQLDAVQGTDKLLHGSGAPSAGTGSKGDVYINTSAWAVYGPKSTSGWGDPASMVGPRGKEGPQGGVGPAGRDGTDGADGAPGTDGKDGAIAWVRKAGELGYSRSTVEVSGGGVTVTDDEEADLVRIDFAAVSGLPDHTSGDTRKILRLSPGPTVLPGWEDLPAAAVGADLAELCAEWNPGEYTTFAAVPGMTGTNGVLISTGNINAGSRTYFQLVYLPKDTQVDRIGVFKAAGSGTATVRLGRYSLTNTGATISTGAREVVYGDVAVTSGSYGMFELTINETLTRGFHWLAASVTALSGTVTCSVVGSTPTHPRTRGSRYAGGGGGAGLAAPADMVTTMPAAFASSTFVSGTPVVYLRKAV